MPTMPKITLSLKNCINRGVGSTLVAVLLFGVVCGEESPIATPIDLRLVRVDACDFIMGSPIAEQGRRDHEILRRVKISQAFLIGATEITQSQWKAVMGTEPWANLTYVKAGENFPAVGISYEMAVDFCDRLSRREKRQYRLPSEAEWECACRAGTTTTFHFGDEQGRLADYGWYGKNSFDIGNRFAHQVGKKTPNAWGLYDMHGNLWEWCSDWFTSATVPKGRRRVVRGGSWHGAASLCRSASRFSRDPTIRVNDTGFRVVLEAEPELAADAKNEIIENKHRHAPHDRKR